MPTEKISDSYIVLGNIEHIRYKEVNIYVSNRRFFA